MKVKPFYIEIEATTTPQEIQDAFDKCVDAGASPSEGVIDANAKHTYTDSYEINFDHFGVNSENETYFYDGASGYGPKAQEITLDQLDEWLGLDKTETPEEKEAFDSMSKGDSDNIHKPSWAKWSIGEEVTKIKGSSWTGKVVGYYSTSLTSKGYAVESLTEKGSVQIYPEAALRGIETPQQREERERLEAAYDLYLDFHCAVGRGVVSLEDFEDAEFTLKGYLSIVDKTGYRKAK